MCINLISLNGGFRSWFNLRFGRYFHADFISKEYFLPNKNFFNCVYLIENCLLLLQYYFEFSFIEKYLF